MAKPKKEQDGEVRGRALVDIPSVGAKCGDYLSLPADVAEPLVAAGEFDPKAEKAE